MIYKRLLERLEKEELTLESFLFHLAEDSERMRAILKDVAVSKYIKKESDNE